MDNKKQALDIYLMGIGGTGMGAFAGLLKQKGHRVSGSDIAVYSPMKEKLREWNISYHAPYDAKNLPEKCDLVIIGNVIRKDNPEALSVMAKQVPYDSFPRALNRLFLKDTIPIVATGTHGKTTCSALLAHTLFAAGYDPGFLIGGIPINFGESFRAPSRPKSPFVVEGDEYDTAFFDKRPKFMHYDPHYLLLTSLEFDHGDIYRDLDSVIDAFASLLKTLGPKDSLVLNADDPNIKHALARSQCQARSKTYGSSGDFVAADCQYNEHGLSFTVKHGAHSLGDIVLPLFGEHNLNNALGCYAILHEYGLSHRAISDGFAKFLGTKRRLEEKCTAGGHIVVDDFAHHPSAVKETIKAARQRYPNKRIAAIFEPRSATSCTKIFEPDYQQAFLGADLVLLAPVGRSLPEKDRLNTNVIAEAINQQGAKAQAFDNYEDLRAELSKIPKDNVLLFMSNGDFQGLLKDVEKIFC
ncbi:MAG TPA: Mur ligase family protein [Myxococcota bacterium]|nr:Mur ligase family protein [Myxococcota bacterium]